MGRPECVYKGRAADPAAHSPRGHSCRCGPWFRREMSLALLVPARIHLCACRHSERGVL